MLEWRWRRSAPPHFPGNLQTNLRPDDGVDTIKLIVRNILFNLFIHWVKREFKNIHSIILNYWKSFRNYNTLINWNLDFIIVTEWCYSFSNKLYPWSNNLTSQMTVVPQPQQQFIGMVPSNVVYPAPAYTPSAGWQDDTTAVPPYSSDADVPLLENMAWATQCFWTR